MKENWSRLWLVLNVELLQIHCSNDPPCKMASNGAMIQVQISSNMYICNHLYIYIYIAVGFSNWPYTHTVIILTDTSRLCEIVVLPNDHQRIPPKRSRFSTVTGAHTSWSFVGYYFGSPPLG